MKAEDAWARFWASGSACLPNAAALLAGIEADFWRAAVDGLPRHAAVLDLATGDGAVLAVLKRLRPDLELQGVDSAPALPPAPSGIRVLPATSVEQLPFRDGCFQLVTSRFGVEYANPARAAAEASRVLAPGGRLRWLCHHAESRVVLHNAGRQAALAWAARESGVLDRALALAAARARMPLPTPPSFRAAVGEAQARFPEQSVAAEFTAAVLASLGGGGRPAAPAETPGLLGELRTRADAEIARLQALASAARDRDGIGEIVAELVAAGTTVGSVTALSDGDSAYAWAVAAERAE